MAAFQLAVLVGMDVTTGNILSQVNMNTVGIYGGPIGIDPLSQAAYFVTYAWSPGR